MTISEAIEQLTTYTIPCGKYKEAYDMAIDIMRKYQMFQADYKARLKADMVAMLNEFDLELYEKYEDTDLIKVKYIRQAIQQKIDKLKEVEQEFILDKIRTEIDQEYTKFRNKSDMWNERACGLGTALEIIDKSIKEEADGQNR